MCILLFACKGGEQNMFSAKSEGGDTLKLTYAHNINIVKHGDYTIVSLANPWKKGEILHSYLLCANPNAISEDVKKGHTVVKTPLKKSLVATAVHCSLFAELGCKETVAGVCESNYINLDFIKEGVNSKKIADCGSGMQPDVERVMALSPDAIMLSPYESSAGYGKVDQLNIPIIELVDYMETSPLARAEWMLFYGMLVGKEDEAQKILDKVVKEYEEYKTIASDDDTKMKVLIDKMYQATWFLPGGQSTIGIMLNDANCNYIYSDEKNSGSIERSFEQVLDKAADADIWLLRYGKMGNEVYNLQSLSKENEKYSIFKPYKSGEIYGCETSETHFFEETPFHPERLLRDFVILTHPQLDLAKNSKTKYFKKL